MRMWHLVFSALMIVDASGIGVAQKIPKIISIEEGIEAVRKFEEVGDLKLKYLGLSWRYGFGERWVWPLYCFYSIDGRLPEISYSVCPYTGKVISRKDWKVDRKIPESGDLEAMIPPKEAFDIVSKFIHKYSPGFQINDYKIWVDELRSHYQPNATYKTFTGWISFFFYKQMRGWEGSVTRNLMDKLSVDIHPFTGELCDYWRINYPVKHLHFRPKISEFEAKKIALGHMKWLNTIYPAKHRWSRRVGCAFAYRVRASYVICTDYPNYLIPVWYVTVIYSLSRPDIQNFPYCGGHEHSVTIHAESGEVLGSSMVFGTDIPPVKIDAKYLKWYDEIPIQVSWDISIARTSSGVLGIFYPFPMVRGKKVYIKPTFAWLMGVKVEEDGEGYRMEGLQKEFVKIKEVIIEDNSVWLPLDKVAKASRAKVKIDLREKWLKIEPGYVREAWRKCFEKSSIRRVKGQK